MQIIKEVLDSLPASNQDELHLKMYFKCKLIVTVQEALEFAKWRNHYDMEIRAALWRLISNGSITHEGLLENLHVKALEQDASSAAPALS